MSLSQGAATFRSPAKTRTSITGSPRRTAYSCMQAGGGDRPVVGVGAEHHQRAVRADRLPQRLADVDELAVGAAAAHGLEDALEFGLPAPAMRWRRRIHETAAPASKPNPPTRGVRVGVEVEIKRPPNQPDATADQWWSFPSALPGFRHGQRKTDRLSTQKRESAAGISSQSSRLRVHCAVHLLPRQLWEHKSLAASAVQVTSKSEVTISRSACCSESYRAERAEGVPPGSAPTDALYDCLAYPRRSGQLRESGHPLVLTVNGKAEIVVQDAKSYQRLLELADRLETIEAVKEGLASMERGEGKPVDEVFDEMEKDLRAKARP